MTMIPAPEGRDRSPEVCRHLRIGRRRTRQDQGVAFVEPCSQCGRAPIHRLGCPVLTRVTAVATVFFGIVTLILIVVWAAGGPIGNITLAALITAFFAGYALLSGARGA